MREQTRPMSVSWSTRADRLAGLSPETFLREPGVARVLGTDRFFRETRAELLLAQMRRLRWPIPGSGGERGIHIGSLVTATGRLPSH